MGCPFDPPPPHPHETSELVLARIALLTDQSRSVLPLQSAEAREFGELWRETVRAGQN